MTVDCNKLSFNYAALCCFIFFLLATPSATYADCTTLTLGDKPEGYVFYNTDYGVLQACRNDGNWIALGLVGPDPCILSSPSPGDVCAGGSVYAGLSPDGNVPMYAAATDAGGIPWNDGNANFTATGQTSTIAGEANTSSIVGMDSNNVAAGIQPHQAAQHCADLVLHGHTDWYLPSKDELGVLFTNRAVIGNLNTSGSFPAGYYWSSSENNAGSALIQQFSSGAQFGQTKSNAFSVRCVRK